jgi:hypothetical protein
MKFNIFVSAFGVIMFTISLLCLVITGLSEMTTITFIAGLITLILDLNLEIKFMTK